MTAAAPNEDLADRWDAAALFVGEAALPVEDADAVPLVEAAAELEGAAEEVEVPS